MTNSKLTQLPDLIWKCHTGSLDVPQDKSSTHGKALSWLPFLWLKQFIWLAKQSNMPRETLRPNMLCCLQVYWKMLRDMAFNSFSLQNKISFNWTQMESLVDPYSAPLVHLTVLVNLNKAPSNGIQSCCVYILRAVKCFISSFKR